MDPLDPGKNVEGSECSKRRISSILKVPRKLSALRDSEQQENEVESAKPVEKRNSRRVSFAPANDVLLFAKDAKNGSPARSPLQDLTAAATVTTQNRVQVVANEDTSPQILGIETLLNAPLHTSQQRVMVHFDSGNDFGEKTVMFSTEDAIMDMTRSHTININSDPELLGDLSLHNYELLLSEGDAPDVFTDVPPSLSLQAANPSSSSLLVDKKADSTLSTTVPLLDPDFKNFLSSLSKQSPSGTNAILPGMTLLAGPSSDETQSSFGHSETQIKDVDKENQVPTSLRSSRQNIGESFHGSTLYPEDDVSMDMTEAQTSRILGVEDDDDPFQCLFPTQEMYEKCERTTPPARELKMQQSCKSVKSNDLKAKTSLTNPYLNTPSQSHRVSSVLKDNSREKTVVFTEDDFMDVTQSHTRKNNSSSKPSTPMSADSFNSRYTELPTSLSITSDSHGNLENPRFLPISAPSSKKTVSTDCSLTQHKRPWKDSDQENSPLSTNRSSGEPSSDICPEGDVSMDMTEVQTGRIVGVLGSDPFQFVITSQENHPLCKTLKKEGLGLGEQNSEGPGSSDHTGVETSSKLSLNIQVQKHQDEVITADDCSRQPLFSSNDAGLDVTQSHPVSIATYTQLDPHKDINVSPSGGENTVRFVTDDCAMDMTRCLTMNIATNLAPDLIPSIRKQEYPSGNRFSSSYSFSTPNDCNANHGVERTTAATAESSDGFAVYQEDDMDITEAQTGCILGAELSMNLTGVQTDKIVEMAHKNEPLQAVSPTGGTHRQRVNEKTEKLTCQQRDQAFGASNYAGTETSTKTSLKKTVERNQVEYDLKDDYREKTVRFAIADGFMDFTRCNTLDISSDLPLPNLDLPANGEKTVRFNANDAEMDVTKSHTVHIMRDIPLQSFPNVVSPANGEKTVRFSANDAAMDVTRSHTVRIATDLINEDPLPAGGEKTVRFNANDAEMDVTKSHTVHIMRDLPLQSFPNVVSPANGEKTVRFSANEAAMDVTRSLTVRIATDLINEDPLPAGGEKTVRFSANDAEMDVTRSHTVDIAYLNVPLNKKAASSPTDGERKQRFCASDAEMDVTKSHTVNMRDLPLQSLPNAVVPWNGEKTVTFSANDAPMDVTKSHTVRIATDIINENLVPAGGEKTMRLTTNDAAMDATRSHPVNIAHDLNLLANQKRDNLPADGERTVRFGVNDADMEVTKSLTVKILANSNVAPEPIVNPPPAEKESLALLTTNYATMDVTHSPAVNISADFNQNPNQIMNSLPTDTEKINTLVDETGNYTRSISKNYKVLSDNFHSLLRSGDKTKRFTTKDATMDMTHCLSVNIVSNQLLDPVVSDQSATSVHENVNDTLTTKETDSGNCGLDSNSSSSAKPEQSLNNSLSQASSVEAKPEGDPPSCPDSIYSHLKTKEPDTDAENESPSLVSNVDQPVNKTQTDAEEAYACMDRSEDQTETPVSSTDNPPQGVCSEQHPDSKSFKETDSTLKIVSAPGSVSDETENVKQHQSKAEIQAVSQKMESSTRNADRNADVLPSRISRRKSLADLQSKVRRLSQLINAAPDATAMESCTAPLLHLDPDLDKNPNSKISYTPVVEPALEMDLGNNTSEPSVATSTTPFRLKTKQLMSRLSVGGFKPKLPKRNTAEELKKSFGEGEPTKTFTVSVPSQLSRLDTITDIYDEELVDCEDLSETVDTVTPEKISKKENISNQFMFQPSEDAAFMDDIMSSSQRQKRCLPEDEDEKEDEKRQRMCPEFAETASHPDEECDSNITTARTQTIDSSSSIHTGSRCEIASESTCKYSLFESQLEDDYGSDGQKKLEDGSITVLEFFNLFSIDFVIHNPRHSVLPGRLLDSTDATPLDLLKDKHISRPRQTVYEEDVQTLTEKVEGLKYRMQDLGKPLKILNRSLWEEVKNFTEKELKSFGAKLKEKNNFFRKNSKVQSHEMKEVLYANLVLANLEEQQKLKGRIDQADEMIQTLDSCISELEAELHAVEEKGSEDKASLKSLQEEMSNVTESLADYERQISELQFGEKKTSADLKRLKAEERNLQSCIDMLNMVNEWRLEQKVDDKDNCSVYTFLHRTMFLQLMYENTNGNDSARRSERKITNINFTFNLNDEKSQSHARLVHKLVSQYIEGESGWVEKYPTNRHVPELLHDVSLLVSRCRLVGEELRLLKMWGSLRFDILDISCSETQVHIVFSSLKKRSKFEVIFSAMLTNQLCVFHVQSFKNLLGSTTIQQIEEVVASLSPGKSLLTKIIKKLHETLLS